MSLQTAAILMMDHSARGLDGLAEGKILPDECHFAATRFRASILRLSVEPLHRQDIRASLDLVVEARPCLQKIHDEVKVDSPEWGWVICLVKVYGSLLDLLSAMDGLHASITLDRPGIKTMPAGLRRLLPACWWGSR